MKQFIYSFSLFCILVFISHSAFAEDSHTSGFVVSAGFGGTLAYTNYDTTFGACKCDILETSRYHSEDGWYGGLSSIFSIGYRWKYGGIYLEETLGEVRLFKKEYRPATNEYYDGLRYITSLVGKFTFPVKERFNMLAILGFGFGYAGVAYEPKDEDKPPFHFQLPLQLGTGFEYILTNHIALETRIRLMSTCFWDYFVELHFGMAYVF